MNEDYEEPWQKYVKEYLELNKEDDANRNIIEEELNNSSS